MSEFVAALPMYDWPQMRGETDAEWSRLRNALLGAGVDAPERLARRNADLPPVPGGVRDSRGMVIAPDPATLPPDELDLQTLWRHPKLLLAQTCWGPMEEGLSEHVTVVAQPGYDGIEGGRGGGYSSAILMRLEDDPSSGRPEEGVRAPADGTSAIPLDLIRGKRLAYNSPDSMSGIIALSRDLETAGESIGIFGGRLETGSHRASVVAVAEGKADVCAIDCRSWMLAGRHEPLAAKLQIVGWTARRNGLPMIASVHTPPEIVERLRQILAAD